MPHPLSRQSCKGLLTLLAFTCSYFLSLAPAKAQQGITTVFYILLENRCFSSGTDKSYTNVIYGNSAAPYLNKLCTPGDPNAVDTSYCSAYHHVNSKTTGDNIAQTGSTTNGSGAGGSVHPSEPNYVWMEAGSNLSKYDDNEPYGTGNSVAQIATFLSQNPSYTGENLTGLLQNAGITWTCYVEGTCLLNSAGQDFNANTTAGGATLTNNISPIGKRTVPLASFSGTSSTYTNAYNGSHQYNFATKHTGALFFPATNGSTVTTANQTTSNVAIYHYAPLEQLTADLANTASSAYPSNYGVAQYNVITPDQYNDGHTALTGNFVYNGTTYTGGSDLARIAQMDNFCAIIVPQIKASPVYQAGHTAIVIWTDETEGSSLDDYYHTLLEIVISPQAKGNAYNSTLNFTHSSDVATMQKVFGVVANTPSGYLNDAVNASQPTVGTATTNSGQGLVPATGQPFMGFGTGTALDLSDMFKAGVIPSGIPAFNYMAGGYAFNRRTNTYSQTVTVTNVLSVPVTTPVYLVVSSLANGTLANGAGTTTNNYAGSPYVLVSPTGLAAGASATVTLQFNSTGGITEALQVVSTSGAP